jgi:hypothetical protein
MKHAVSLEIFPKRKKTIAVRKTSCVVYNGLVGSNDKQGIKFSNKPFLGGKGICSFVGKW